MELENQIAVVTGGQSGMGAACVKELTKRGVRVMSWDKQVATHPQTIECDVTSAQAIEQALNQTVATLGIPRILINCAGIAPACRMVGKESAMPLEAFRQVIDVNLIGTFNVMSKVAFAMTQLPLSGDSERGVIINTASIAAYEGQIGQAAYSASKGGVVAMTLPVARELAQHAIRVNTIAPGLIATPMLLNMPQDVQSSLAQTIPFPKRFGRPEEFASLVIHLIENSMMNGEVIRLDGALRMAPK